MSVTQPDAATIPQLDSVAQDLLHSTIPARLAYVWHDGTPRVVPMWFHWTGQEILMGAPPNAPKVKALGSQPRIAFTIDSTGWPYGLLSVRGSAAFDLVAQPVSETFPEYVQMAQRYLGDIAGQEFLRGLQQRFSHWARITLRPDEVRILDFTQRFPSAWSRGA
jgi:hypothetical protein